MTAAHGGATEGEVGAFVEASARLTGFGAAELWALDVAEEYRAVVLAQAGPERCERLVGALSGSGAATPAGLDEELLEAARALTHLWYTGSWPEWAGDGAFVVSSASYAAGLVWRAVGGRAPGTRPAGSGRRAGVPVAAESGR
ncbi:hypothetical protein [Streptomyces sp. NPDC048527]|uniref:hypothetical protein n=1 Tax=Streptomyces sp. NPDC048527 TaxID=3365568 RepID=UPI00371253C9